MENVMNQRRKWGGGQSMDVGGGESPSGDNWS